MDGKTLLLAGSVLAALQGCSIPPRARAVSPDSIGERLITGRTVVIAHRGGSGPDGTRASAGRSMAAGVTFIELDVRLTRDGRAVILHDPTVDRTTDGTGPVAEKTLEEVRRLDAGAKYKDPAEPGRSFAGERIPTVREMIRFVGERGVLLLELKVAEAADMVTSVVRGERAFHRVVVRSADRAVLRRIKQLDARVQIGTMAPMPEKDLDRFVDELDELGVVAFTAPAADRAQVEKFRAKGIAVWGSNTNDPAVMAKLIEAGVDGIITDDGPALAGLLRKQNPAAEPPRTFPPPEEEEEPVEATGHTGLRAGLWMMPGFRALVPGGLREFTDRALVDIGVDFSMTIDPVFLLASIDYGTYGEVSVRSGSIQVGIEAGVGELVFPLSVRGSVGVLFAELEVDETRFGEFDHGVGFLARAELMARVSGRVGASLWVDFRHVEFDYEPQVVGGDKTAGGAMIAAGLSVVLRF